MRELAPPKPGRVLLETHEIPRTSRDTLALRYAGLHVPPKLAYAIEVMRANAALRRGDQAGWLAHLNAYLDQLGTAPVHLGAGETLPNRFRCAALSAVTGGLLITVILPAWNAKKTVRAATSSILDQSWRNLELLIVDDSSTDGSWGELQRLAAEDMSGGAIGIGLHRGGALCGSACLLTAISWL